MREHIYPVKALQPDVLPQSDYLPVYATFQSYIAFFVKKTSQKQAIATLQNSKTHVSSMVIQMPHAPTHWGIYPNGSTSATTFWWLPFGNTVVTHVKSLGYRDKNHLH